MKLLFFPDEKEPCSTFYDKIVDQRVSRCRCQRLHAHETRSSFMQMLEYLEGAKRIDICIYMFTLKELADLLIRMRQKGCYVRIITDSLRGADGKVDLNSGQYKGTGDQIPRLRAMGITVKEIGNTEDTGRPLMHNKFVVIDNQRCIFGSFNWTKQAVLRNNESIALSDDPDFVRPLVKEFDRLWRLPNSNTSQNHLRTISTTFAWH